MLTHASVMQQAYQASLTACVLRLPRTSAQLPDRKLHGMARRTSSIMEAEPNSLVQSQHAQRHHTV